MTSPEGRLEILRAETEGLADFLGGLPKEAWDLPSACDGWSIADVVAHLTLTRGFSPSRIMRAIQDDASPDDQSPHLRIDDVDPATDAEEAIALSNELGGNLLKEFIKASRGIVDALAKIGPQEWDKTVFRPSRPEPARNVVDIFICEFAVHGWDIRSRFDSQSGLSPESVAVMVERIPKRGTWWSFRTEAGFAPSPIRYRFRATKPTRYQVDLVVTEKERYMEVTSSDDAHVTFQCDGDTFVFLMYGRIGPEAAIASGRMSYTGDQRLMSAFVQRFTGG
ncbi:MAG: maleylpyruvate isomerase N-terminal domain-containing protein [Chloroflexi bacterium]|nr:maleylpyruvate isomerase N-terminal domain-containing protein [Chloroflexota bacterium]